MGETASAKTALVKKTSLLVAVLPAAALILSTGVASTVSTTAPNSRLATPASSEDIVDRVESDALCRCGCSPANIE
eukprot:CAMPEP_0173169040 /NCGR_PEP_ID=MMETSP1141-20130122/482_1 /TAXON_ID=483371 /ORGANISM="non described non described, Strain CCMP2298" /LENGTH=75 /DNA_ID=CAMNT_0014090821 /DNA_START=782 /DNA_END=1009 /DNA_ORIENTATION=+